MKPNFLVVGAQKAGTTSLHNYLYDHPDIYLPSQKETKFFVRNKLYNRGMSFYQREFFSTWCGQHAIGEVDPDYMYIQIALDRIVKQIKKTKLIFIFRNPVERAFSHYLMTYRRGREPLAFKDAIAHEHDRINQNCEMNMDFSYVSRGFYAKQLERFTKHYDSSQMLFILSEDLRYKSTEVLKQCFEFLNVDANWQPDNINKQFHQASVPKSVLLYRAVRYQSPIKSIARLLVPGKTMRKTIRDAIYDWNTTENIRQTMTDETRHYLIELYREENLRLGELIGCDLNHWNQ